MSVFRSLIALAFLIFSGSLIAPAVAQDNPTAVEQSLTAQESAALHAFENALRHAVVGPKSVPLIDQATVDLPDAYIFVPKDQAAGFMKAIGNDTGEDFIGMVMPKEHPNDWFITIDYLKSGYVSDAEAKNWNPDDLLKEIKDSNDQANESRTANGFPPLDIQTWLQKPNYDFTAHRLVWALLAKERGLPTGESSTVNYNTYALGRDGYFVLNLVTNSTTVEKDKAHALRLLAALKYNSGKSYTDFVKGKDQVAEYGIAALVAGVAAKKLGLLAAAGVFILKIWKLAALAGVVFLGRAKTFFRKIFKGKDPQP